MDALTPALTAKDMWYEMKCHSGGEITMKFGSVPDFWV